MKPININNRDYEIIARYLAHEMNADEEKSFKKEVNAHENIMEEFRVLQKFWNRLNKMKPENTSEIVDTDTAWEKLSNRIIQDDNSNNKRSEKRNFAPVWLKAAASFLLIVSLGFAVWFITGDRSDENLLTFNTDDTDVTLVQKLNDGSVVYMARNTNLLLTSAFDDRQRKVLLTGEAFFDVQSNPQKPFFIETSVGEIEVLGTSFNVKTLENNGLEVFVEIGKVQVNVKGGQLYQLEQGELLEVIDGVAEISFAADLYNTAWRKNHMQFKDETLENILSVLDQNFTANLQVNDPELNQRRLTVTFYQASPELMAELIAVSLDIDVEINGNDIVFFKKRIE
ncbi:MAG: FecR family protein [Bacteroidales bacterium]